MLVQFIASRVYCLHFLDLPLSMRIARPRERLYIQNYLNSTIMKIEGIKRFGKKKVHKT